MVLDKEASDLDQEVPQSQTTDQPTAPRGRDTNTNNHMTAITLHVRIQKVQRGSNFDGVFSSFFL